MIESVEESEEAMVKKYLDMYYFCKKGKAYFTYVIDTINIQIKTDGTTHVEMNLTQDEFHTLYKLILKNLSLRIEYETANTDFDSQLDSYINREKQQ